MISLGIDIGTTSICVIALDLKKGSIIQSVSANHAFLEEGSSFIQDGDRIVAIVKELLSQVLTSIGTQGDAQTAGTDRTAGADFTDIQTIGITCQMHGILYVDKDGQACSPFYTWKNTYGDQIIDDNGTARKVTGDKGSPAESESSQNTKTWCQVLREKTGQRIYSGYGSATHYYLQKKGLISPKACTFVSIGDYLGMKLTGSKTAKADPSLAASFGFFDLKAGRFDKKAMESAGIDPSYYPQIAAAGEKTGMMDWKGNPIPVLHAIGDNQASFRGAVEEVEKEKTISVNVGTGSQVSIWFPRLLPVEQIEVRPFPGGGFLYVGASLNGGKVYEKLGNFFREIGEAFGCKEKDAYEVMNRLGEKTKETSLVTVPDLYGKRENESEKLTPGAGFYSLTIQNFHPGDFIRSYVAGMAGELHTLYEVFPREIRNEKVRIVASGNGLRKNQLLCDEIKKQFGMELYFTAFKEEAAAGAALYGAACR